MRMMDVPFVEAMRTLHENNGDIAALLGMMLYTSMPLEKCPINIPQIPIDEVVDIYFAALIKLNESGEEGFTGTYIQVVQHLHAKVVVADDGLRILDDMAMKVLTFTAMMGRTPEEEEDLTLFAHAAFNGWRKVRWCYEGKDPYPLIRRDH